MTANCSLSVKCNWPAAFIVAVCARLAIWTSMFALIPVISRTRVTHVASDSLASTTSTRTSALIPTNARILAVSAPSRSFFRRSTLPTCATTPGRNRTSVRTAVASSHRHRVFTSMSTFTWKLALTSATSAASDSRHPTNYCCTLRWATPASRPTPASSVTNRLTSGDQRVHISKTTVIWCCEMMTGPCWTLSCFWWQCMRCTCMLMFPSS